MKVDNPAIRLWISLKKWAWDAFPEPCLLCGDRETSAALCAGCRSDLPALGAACPGCSLPWPTALAADRHCGACQQRPPPWCSARAPLRYEFPADRLIGMLKFRGQLAAGRLLAELMLTDPHGQPEWPPGVIVPVPLHRHRLARRGFNQAGEIGLRLAGLTQTTMLAGLVRRGRTRPQSGLDARERRLNVRGAFAWQGPPLSGAPVILVDDVMTTGATLAACTRVLLQAGAGEVHVRVATRTPV